MNLKDKDLMGLVSYYVIYTNNSDTVKELFEKPVKLFIGFMLVCDWVLFRVDLDINRLYIFISGIVGLPLYIIFQYHLGKSQLVLKLRNRMEQLTRKKNDSQRAELFRKIDEMYKKLMEE